MAGVPMGYRATLYDLANKRQLEVYLEGDAFRTDRQVGGGPMPPGPGGGPGDPPGIWGGPIDPYPDHGLPGQPPGIWGGGNRPFPTPPIVIPPDQLPPNVKPPETPAPGSPSAKVPGEFPVNPITPQPYYVFNWPGIGPVYIYPPADPAAPTPQGRR